MGSENGKSEVLKILIRAMEPNYLIIVLSSVLEKFFRPFAYVGREVLVWKECQPVVRKPYPDGYSQCPSCNSIDILPKSFTRYGDVVDPSCNGPLSQRTSGVGNQTENAECKSSILANEKLLEERKKPT
ncbi:hypothetical protein TNCV_2434031 [Trichonephila clavipes]|nr:hypothetical protein TNCV_2434031 [Trichonephila clavipes]